MNYFFIGQVSPIAFRLLGWPVHWYGLIIGFGMVIAYFMVMKEAKRNFLDSDRISDMMFWTILLGFVGARLYYVLFRLNFYISNPSHIFSIWEGGIAIYGGVLAGIATIWYLSKRYGLSFVKVVDIAAPALMIAQVIGRWGNFINQEAHGFAVERTFLEKLMLPEWLIEHLKIQGTYYHPTFLYESVWNLLGVILLVVLRNQKGLLKQGEVALGYLLWYGLGRIVIEGMRTDSLHLGPLRVSQWLAGLFIIISIGLIIYRRRDIEIESYTYNRN